MALVERSASLHLEVDYLLSREVSTCFFSMTFWYQFQKKNLYKKMFHHYNGNNYHRYMGKQRFFECRFHVVIHRCEMILPQCAWTFACCNPATSFSSFNPALSQAQRLFKFRTCQSIGQKDWSKGLIKYFKKMYLKLDETIWSNMKRNLSVCLSVYPMFSQCLYLFLVDPTYQPRHVVTCPSVRTSKTLRTFSLSGAVGGKHITNAIRPRSALKQSCSKVVSTWLQQASAILLSEIKPKNYFA